MNIEIANRLVELRKKSGLSQEELASKLGLSRQAVSKWERAEASPDTDNLICLAKLYNVSLDDLLNTDQPIDEVLKETKEINEEKKEEAKAEPKEEETEEKKKIVIDDHQICIHDGAGNEKVYICDGTIRIDGKDYKEKTNHYAVAGIVSGCLFTVVAAAYVICGIIFGNPAWAIGWPIFMFPVVISSLIEAIQKRKWCTFGLPVFIAMVYCYIGMIGTVYAGSVPSWLGWHPWWVLFLLIPVYYSTFSVVDKHHAKKELANGNLVIDNKEDIEDARKEVLKAEKELNEAKIKYESLKKEAETNQASKDELEDAEEEVRDCEKDLKDALERVENAAEELRRKTTEIKED